MLIKNIIIFRKKKKSFQSKDGHQDCWQLGSKLTFVFWTFYEVQFNLITSPMKNMRKPIRSAFIHLGDTHRNHTVNRVHIAWISTPSIQPSVNSRFFIILKINVNKFLINVCSYYITLHLHLIYIYIYNVLIENACIFVFWNINWILKFFVQSGSCVIDR